MKSLTIDEFCRLHGISRSYFYKMAAQGIAPAIYKIGRCTRISETANNEWLRRRESTNQLEAA